MSKMYRRWKNNKNSRLLNKYYPDMKYKRSFLEYKKFITKKNLIRKKFKKIALMIKSLPPHKRKDMCYMDLFINYNHIKFFYNELNSLCIYNKLQIKNTKSKYTESRNVLGQKENVSIDWNGHFASDYIERKIKEGNLPNGIILNMKEQS